MDLNAIIPIINKWHQSHYRVVLVTGVFDLLHSEHLQFLSKAKAAGDKLVVGIESDVRVKQIKGPNRPINSEPIRLKQIQALKPVDLAFILPEAFTSSIDHERLIQLIKPQTLAVSSHTKHLAKKRAICQKYGTTVQIVHSHNPHTSTTQLIRSQNRHP